eukprot:374537_1
METMQCYILILLSFISINPQNTNTATISSKGCAYTVLPDDRLAKGVAVPLDTCIQTPFPPPGTSYTYKCNHNKTQVQLLQYDASGSCDSTESIVINTTIAVEDFECDGDPCPSVNYVDRTWIETQDQECKDGGSDLGIGGYVTNHCTFYGNYSAMTTCDKSSITFTRYNSTTKCEEIGNNVRITKMSIGCQYRINPPYTPNGWIESIRCPGYDYSHNYHDGLSFAIIVTIVVVVVGVLIIFIIICKKMRNDPHNADYPLLNNFFEKGRRKMYNHENARNGSDDENVPYRVM